MALQLVTFQALDGRANSLSPFDPDGAEQEGPSVRLLFSQMAIKGIELSEERMFALSQAAFKGMVEALTREEAESVGGVIFHYGNTLESGECPNLAAVYIP